MKVGSIDWLILVDIGDTALYVTRPHAATLASIVSEHFKFCLPWFKKGISEISKTLDSCAYCRLVIMVTSCRSFLLMASGIIGVSLIHGSGPSRLALI